MSGMSAVFWKELGDYCSSRRFVILLALIYLPGVLAIYSVASFIRSEVSETSFVFLLLFTSSGGFMPPFDSFSTFLALFIPIIGIALGFDAINSERSSGTLTRVLSQPIYRDSVVNGKFLAGLFTIATLLTSLVLLVAGVGLRMIGVPPTLEEISRLVVFLLVTILYAGFWLSLAILFSLLFTRPATSALASIAIWLFFFFALLMSVGAQEEIIRLILGFSPVTLYLASVAGLLVPSLTAIMAQGTGSMLPNPLSFSQSFLMVWPQIVIILVLTIVCFAAAYIKFMREEIRAT
ncbi:ABC transporter permease [Chloroflexota bacterium]